MPFLMVGSLAIPVAPGGGKVDRDEGVDRRRAFDKTYRASVTGGAARDLHFSTPPVSRALANSYMAALSIVSPQMCSGESLGLPTVCCTELIGWTPTAGSNGQHLAIVDFVLHEVQSSRILFKYTPGDTIPGEVFTGAAGRTYFDANGILQTAGLNIKRDGHFVGGVKSLLRELTRTNIVLWNRDMTNAAWVKTTMTPLKDQVGIDGASNSASSLLATAANATCIQSTVTGSSARFQSAFIKRLVGSGVIQMTMDNGATWTPITVTAAYTRVSIPTQTVANPNVGFRIVTSGDKIAVDYVQNENGTFASSPILTTTAAVARGAESYSLPFPIAPMEMSSYTKFVELGTTLGAGGARLWQISNAASGTPQHEVFDSAGVYSVYHHNGGSAVSTSLPAAPAYGDTTEVATHLFGDGSVDIWQSVNGAPATSGPQTSTPGLAPAWSGNLLWLNSEGTAGNEGFVAIQSIKFLAGSRLIEDLRAA